MIYDCFKFFNELDLLEIRLNVLNDIVDKVVLVEATTTHVGTSKPLYYEQNKERFKAFHHKIIHVIVDDRPAETFALWRPDTAKGPWQMENYQRNAIGRGLTACKPDDIIIISDLDEIPDPKKIREFADSPGFKVFQQKNFYYYLNCVADSEQWYGTVMGFYKDCSRPQDFRAVSKKMHGSHGKFLNNPVKRLYQSILHPYLRKKITIIENGGWHFSYLGGADQIIEKIEGMAHNEYNTSEFKNRESILEKISTGKDLFERDLKYSFIEIDNSFPEYISRNKAQLKKLIR